MTIIQTIELMYARDGQKPMLRADIFCMIILILFSRLTQPNEIIGRFQQPKLIENDGEVSKACATFS